MITKNWLLAALPNELLEKLAPSFKLVTVALGDQLHRPGEPIEHLYFPLDSLLSVTITMSDGATAETNMVGSREVLGVNALLDSDAITIQTTDSVQIAGSAVQVDARILREEFDRNKEFRNLMLRSIQAQIAQICQTAACNALHPIERRLARWLLEVQDRMDSNQLKITQEFIAQMLGVRRAGVTQAAQKLQSQGLISYKRGEVTILDQQGLEAAACECFRMTQNEYDRLLGRKRRSD